jgi:hypothetical protein
MAKLFTIISRFMGSFLLLGAFWGCTNSGPNPDAQPLIRVRDHVLTVSEFNQAFEISKTAYSYNLRDEPDEYRSAQLRLLNDLTVEMIIRERAADLGLTVSDEELAKAVADIKKDYPGDTFEKTLLEYAIPYEIWEDRLRSRLLIEKVIDHELKDQIVITSEDIAQYYEKNYKDKESDKDSEMNMEDINKMIIAQLRREKMEKAYQAWISKLKQQYPVEISGIQWERISGTHLNGKEFLDKLESKGE